MRRLVLLVALLASPALAQLGEPHPPYAPEGARVHHPRPRTYDVRHVRLDLSIDLEGKSLAGRATLSVAPIVPALRRIDLDAVDLEVVSARVDGEKAAFAADGRTLAIELERARAVEVPISIEVDYRARPREGMRFVERVAADGSVARMVHTQGQATNHRHWFPCYDEPDDLATTEILATVPDGYQVVSNGRLVLADGEPGPPLDPDGRTRTWHWRQEAPHAIYLVTLVVGRFDVARDEARGVPLSYYAPEGMGRLLAPTFRNTGRMLERFEAATGVEYPWAKYAQVCVLGFDGGGMENTSATTLHADTLRDERTLAEASSDGLIAHELAHQWFGNLVACRDWSEIWLSEGFATYFEAIWFAEAEGPDRAAWELDENRNWYLHVDSTRHRRPLVTRRYASPDDLFDGVTYGKGAWVVHMLRRVVGDEAFFAGLSRYLETNAHRPVGTRELRAAFEAQTGDDLGWFFEQWVENAGHPEIRVRRTHHPEPGVLVLAVEQVQSTKDGTPIFRFPVDVAIESGGEVVRHRLLVEEARHEFVLPCPAPPDLVLFDEGHRLLAVVDFPKSTRERIRQLAQDADVIGRKEAAGGLARELDASAPARDAIRRALLEDASPQLRAHLATEIGRAVHGQAWDPWEAGWDRAEPLVADPTGRLRTWAIEALAEAWRTDGDPRVRTAAVRAAVGFPDSEEAAAVAREAVADRASDITRAAGLRVLARIGAPGAQRHLLEAAGDASFREVVREAVLAGLVDLGSPEAFPVAARFLRPPHEEGLRRAALDALVEVGADDPQTPRILLAHAGDGDLDLARRVIEAIGKVGPLDPAPTLRRLEELAADPSAEPLHEAIADATRAIREAVAPRPEPPSEVARLALEARLAELEAKIKALQAEAAQVRRELEAATSGSK